MNIKTRDGVIPSPGTDLYYIEPGTSTLIVTSDWNDPSQYCADPIKAIDFEIAMRRELYESTRQQVLELIARCEKHTRIMGELNDAFLTWRVC